MSVLRRDFLKYCLGSAAVGLELSTFGTLDKVLAGEGDLPPAGNAMVQNTVPTYPISANVFTTLDKTVVPKPSNPYSLLPRDVSEYAPNHYGEWDANGAPFDYIRPDMQSLAAELSVPDPSATTLLSFFAMSDIHIADKESPAQVNYEGYVYPYPKTPNGTPVGNSSAYSAVILYTTHVLDAAVQTINALHKNAPFDFGISLGDAANNTQYNELRWYIDVLDGKLITPSSGANLGAGNIDYQKPYQPAGLDKSILWYQAIGNHDQFWMGTVPVTVNSSLITTYTGSDILNIGPINSIPPDWATVFNSHGYYMGVVDGTTRYGDIIYAGPEAGFPTPPQIVADPNRRSLSMNDWMGEFLNTTSQPVGHGFTQQMIDDGFACYHFYPRTNIPIKVIVLDDTDKVGGGAAAALDQERYEWLVNELDEGEAAGELMIVCAHIPVRPYAQGAPSSPPSFLSTFTPSSYVSEQALLDQLHTYKNLILWVSGHVHRNTITPQPSPDNDPEKGFWEVETPSLRDFPQQFRRFEIVRNSDNNISIFALDIDAAVNPATLQDGSSSPARTSRSYAIATQQIFNNPVSQGPNVDEFSGVYNAELIKQLSTAMQAKIAQISPVVSSLKINDDAGSTSKSIVTLNNTVAGSVPTHYMASESSNFSGASWLPYSTAPSFTLSSTAGVKTIYFKVIDGSGVESPAVTAGISKGGCFDPIWSLLLG